MPSVPRYSTPQVQQQGMPGVRVSTDSSIESFGGGESLNAFSRASQGFSKEAEKLALEEKKKADDLATTEAYEKTVKMKNDLFWDPQNGAMARKGKASFGAVDEYGTKFDQAADEIEKGLSNEDQKTMYRRMRTKERMELDGQLQRHTFGEYQKFDEETTKATAITLRDDAILNYQNPGKISESIGLQTAMIRANGARLGKSPEATELEIKDAVSQTHSGVINRMLANGQDMAAQEYYKANKTGLDAKDVTTIERALEDGTLRGESQRESDRIIREYSDLGSAREAVRQIKDPKLRDSVDDRVRSEFSIRNQQETVARGRNFMEAYTILESTKKQKGIVAVEDIPANVWGVMPPEQRDAARALVKRLNSPDEQKHDDAVFLKYYGMPEQSLNRVSEADLVQKVRPYVNDSAWSKITTKWQTVRDAKTKPGKENEVKSMYTDEEMVLTGLRSTGSAGITQADTVAEIYKSQTKATAYNRFREKVDQAWQAWAHENGKMPNAEQKKKIVDEMVYKSVFVNKNWFAKDPEVPAVIVTDEEKGLAYVPMAKIDESTQDEMRNYVRSLGKKVTTSKLERMRAARLMNDRDLYKKIAGE